MCSVTLGFNTKFQKSKCHPKNFSGWGAPRWPWLTVPVGYQVRAIIEPILRNEWSSPTLIAFKSITTTGLCTGRLCIPCLCLCIYQGACISSKRRPMYNTLWLVGTFSVTNGICDSNCYPHVPWLSCSSPSSNTVLFFLGLLYCSLLPAVRLIASYYSYHIKHESKLCLHNLFPCTFSHSFLGVPWSF